MSRSLVPRIPRELLWNLTLRELRGKYRRSFLGWTWSLLNPLALVVIYGFVFGVVFGATAPVGDPSGLENYALYLLSGILPWGFFNLVTGLGLGALVGNSGLVRKVAFPRETLVLAQSLFSLVQFSIEISLLVVILSIAGSQAWLWLPITILLMLLLAIFATGIGLMLSVVGVYFRDLPYLWTIIMQVYFFVTPIIYRQDVLQDRVSPLALKVLEWNPMAVFIRSFRHTLYDGSLPRWPQLLYLLGVSLLTFFLGFFVFASLNRRVAEEI
jgi:ABC-type polysaccharide/polyol phosphate export permease